MALLRLSGEAWTAIELHLPKNQPGARRVDDRRVISGIIHPQDRLPVVRCPADYGPSKIDNRFNSGSQRGFWLQLLAALVDAGVVTNSTAINGTYINVQRATFGAKGSARHTRSGGPGAAGPRRSTRLPTSLAVPVR